MQRFLIAVFLASLTLGAQAGDKSVHDDHGKEASGKGSDGGPATDATNSVRTDLMQEMQQQRVQALRAELMAQKQMTSATAKSATHGVLPAETKSDSSRRLTPEEKYVLRMQLQEERQRLLQDSH